MESTEFESSRASSSRPSGWGTRHTLTLLGFWGFAASYSMRFNLSIAIVAMVNSSMSTQEPPLPVFKVDQCHHTKYDYAEHSKTKTSNVYYQLEEDSHGSSVRGNNHLNSSTLKRLESSSIKLLSDQDESDSFERSSFLRDSGAAPGLAQVPTQFNWDEETQGVILGSFFWGYIITQIPGGYLGHRFGGKWPFGIGLVITALFAILTPFSARLGKEFLICTRVIQGLGEGVTMPAMHSILAKWVPVEERSRLSAAVYAGMSLGTAVTTAMSGYIIHYLGWPAVFYISGGMTLIWFIFWTYYVFDSPCDHPRISLEELKYISLTSSLSESEGSVTENENTSNKVNRHEGTPWKDISTSVAFWAILLCQTLETWGIYTLLHEIPSYMKNVLHFNIQQNSLLSALPHVLSWVVTIAVTHCGDWLIEKNFLSVVTVRKSCNTIALWGTAAAMIGIAYSGCDRTATVILITLAIGVYGALLGGVLINLIDIAPNYASILMGIVNTCATISGFGSPWLAGVILNGNPSLERWRYVFLIAAAICFTGNLIYMLMASGKEQKWNRGNRFGSPSEINLGQGPANFIHNENFMELQERRFVLDRAIVIEDIPHFARNSA